MAFELPRETYKGSVREVRLGQGPGALKVGGENVPAFHYFEGAWPNPPRFALEVYDLEPQDWAEAAREPYADVLASPVKWARKCVSEFGAEAICLQLASTDPIEKDTPPEEAAALVKEVAQAVEVPLLVYGSGKEDKDVEVLRAVAEACAGQNLFLGPAVKKNLEEIGRAAQEFGHGVIVHTVLEIPEAKELNKKLSGLLPEGAILFDPFSPSLGYGLEHGYSVMEREKLAGTLIGDSNLQMPLVANLGAECWNSKEAKESRDQGLIWEALIGLTYILAGANLLILRHPESYQRLKKISREG